ncbi:MAG: hypothetical protein ucyna2_00225 [Candidatus Atelocyanobacterium thalassa isolate SIO64986]|uniref:Uncharacterized protein n=1 Tax=Candidatus Atelocyanobacterium thalassa isolate SIO64986 TaxID=1527444 RepID=A0A086CI32_9CHRO|nr:MAG: hypothetical protein ucyna2_00225 [Candidatus Atelocyanobacterium thalassa isolate SIO64986]
MNINQKLLTNVVCCSLGLSTILVSSNVNAADPFTQFYNQACVPEAKKAGLNENEAKKGCNCTIRSLKKKYSSQAFSTLYNKYRAKDGKARQTLTKFGETCFQAIFDNILFDS